MSSNKVSTKHRQPKGDREDKAMKMILLCPDSVTRSEKYTNESIGGWIPVGFCERLGILASRAPQQALDLTS